MRRSCLCICLKCSLEQSTVWFWISVACSRGFVAPNTGDRLCGITECAREWYRIILLYGNIFSSLILDTHMPLPSLLISTTSPGRYLLSAHAASQPWRWLSKVRSHRTSCGYTRWEWRLRRQTILVSVFALLYYLLSIWFRLVSFYVKCNYIIFDVTMIPLHCLNNDYR